MRQTEGFCKVVLFIFILGFFSIFSSGQMVMRSNLKSAIGITVTSPKAGESYKSGFPITVSWTYAGNVGQTVRILLHKNSAPAGDKVLVSWTLDGSGAGTCGTKIPNDAVPGSDYTIVVESNQNPAIKGRSGLFTLADGSPTASMNPAVLGRPSPGSVKIPQIFINKPVSGEQWQLGTSYLIAWTNKSANNAFRAQISLLRGTSGDVIQKTISGNALISQGSFNWTVTPDVPPGQYRIHIRGAGSDENIFGTGEAFTIIKPELNVLPMAKSDYVVGGLPNDLIPINWKYTGKLGDYVTISWVPAQISIGWAKTFIIATEWPIGANGEGQYIINVLDITPSMNLISILRDQKQKMIYGHIEIKVIGSNYSAKGNDFTIRLADK
jgi:hypothetical protein